MGSRLTRRPASSAGQAVPEAVMVAQAHPGRYGVGQREPGTGSIRRRRAGRRLIAPAVLAASVSARRLVVAAQGGDKQCRGAGEAQEVHPEDDQHQLSLA